MIPPLAANAGDRARDAAYVELRARLHSLLAGEDDWIAAMATVVCELHHAFDHFDWTGFYRALRPDLLVIGPYQGTHGCLRIEGYRGVCGAAAKSCATQRIDDVNEFPGHIACSPTTRSEIVVPIVTPDDRLLAVLDIDSNLAAAFSEVDQRHLEAIAADLGDRFGRAP
jgi:L-methionine (R)-S-oxide reductase